MKKSFLLSLLVASIFFLTVFNVSAQLQKPIRTLPSAPSATPAPVPLPKPALPPPPPPLSMLVLNSPNGGENWVTGTQHDITWNRSGDMTGFITIDLYRGGTSPQNKVGTIASGISVTTGRYNWTVGTYQGGTAPAGNNYQVVISAGGKTDPSNGPFTIVAKASPSASLPAPPLDQGIQKLPGIPKTMKFLGLTYPRRGDLLHKGIQYKITWNALNLLKDATLVIELLDDQGTTVLHSRDNLPNTGEASIKIPMALPDEKKLYKMRIRTTDTAPETGAQSEMVRIFIAKETVRVLASLKVKNPITGDRLIGDTIPVKWTSTISCSGNGGPMDDGFRIELIGKTEKNHSVQQELTDVGYVFDNEGPEGRLNWHWDWTILRGSCEPGTYSIKVTSLNKPKICKDESDKFRIIDPQPSAPQQPQTGGTLYRAEITNKKHCYAERYDDTNQQPNPQLCQFPEAPSGQGWVGSWSTYHDLKGLLGANWHESSYTHFRSRLYFPDIYNPPGKTLKRANLQIHVTMNKNNARPASSTVQFCADRLYILAGPWDNAMDFPRYLWDGGINVPYNQSTINIDVTTIVRGWLLGTWKNHGLLLTDFAILPSQEGSMLCWSYYTATLWVEFE